MNKRKFDPSASLYDPLPEIEWLSNDSEWVWNDKKSYREADGSNYLFDPSASLYDSHHEIEWLSNDSEWIWNDRIR